LANAPREADYDIANQLVNYAISLNQGNELMELLTRLRPAYARQKNIIDALKTWDQYVAQALANMNRPEELFAHQTQMTRDYPFDVNIQVNYANVLAGRGEIDAALKFLAQVKEKNGPWQSSELHQLRS